MVEHNCVAIGPVHGWIHRQGSHAEGSEELRRIRELEGDLIEGAMIDRVVIHLKVGSQCVDDVGSCSPLRNDWDEGRIIKGRPVAGGQWEHGSGLRVDYRGSNICRWRVWCWGGSELIYVNKWICKTYWCSTWAAQYQTLLDPYPHASDNCSLYCFWLVQGPSTFAPRR